MTLSGFKMNSIIKFILKSEHKIHFWISRINIFWVGWFYSLFERMILERKRTMFIHTNQPLIISFYIKKVPLCRISDESALIRTFLRKGAHERVNRSGAWGLKSMVRQTFSCKKIFPDFFSKIKSFVLNPFKLCHSRLE